MKKTLSKIKFGDMTGCYLISEEKQVELILYPTHLERLADGRKGKVDPLIQIKLEGDAFPYGFANGHTMRNSATIEEFTYQSQNMYETEAGITVKTILKNKENVYLEHILSYNDQYKGVVIGTIVQNRGKEKIAVEMISSFSLGGITPFSQDEATNRLLLHRIRSKWSNEGRLESNTIEELQLEPTWSRWGVQSEKYGEIGSMPVRRYFPFVAVEDTAEHVVWAAEIACPSSWQVEIYRRDENLCISGGLPDYDFGHWCKHLYPGEVFETPVVYITVCQGNLDLACQRLTGMQERGKADRRAKLPVFFNEFCTTWGVPSEKNINKILSILKGKDIEYFIIDAGWYADPEKGWENSIGDWIVAAQLYPSGLESVVKNIKDAGMKPGIWFELENVGKDAKALEFQEHLLKRNGKVITAGARCFWDMRDEWTFGYLTEKVICMLKRYGFEYIKIDYNESVGIGCDGVESLGEGLRQNMLATQRFLRKIREEIPNIAIELCASGGHRLEPSMLALADYASFSDAHEEKEIPVIAANLHRVMRPEKSQIWAVLRKDDSIQRIVYSIINTFYGVMCLSGDVYDLDSKQWEMVKKGVDFYREISELIKEGTSYYFGPKQLSYRKLKGWQAIVRYSSDESEAMALIHAFKNNGGVSLSIPLEHEFQIMNIYQAENHSIRLESSLLKISLEKDFDAVAIHMKVI